MMGKTTCPQRQRTFLRCLPICFLGGSCPFRAKFRMAGRQVFFFFPFPRQLERVILGVIGGDKALIQLGQVPLNHPRLLAQRCGGSSSPAVFAAVVCLSWRGQAGATNASPGASQVGGDCKPEPPGVAALPRRWLALVWTTAPVCFLRGKLRLGNH